MCQLCVSGECAGMESVESPMTKLRLQYISTTYRQQYFGSILQKPIAFYDAEENSAGTLTSRLSTDPTQLQELLGPNMVMPLISSTSICPARRVGADKGTLFSLQCHWLRRHIFCLRLEIDSRDDVFRFAYNLRLWLHPIALRGTIREDERCGVC